MTRLHGVRIVDLTAGSDQFDASYAQSGSLRYRRQESGVYLSMRTGNGP
ncbi:MAG: hypothetical protein LBV32_04975 [Tannerellaceae bacterium]|nr:hypothetical protein [Tannerellaceae bacterium]